MEDRIPVLPENISMKILVPSEFYYYNIILLYRLLFDRIAILKE